MKSAVDMSLNQVMWCNLSNDSVWCGHNVERKVWSHMVCDLSARLWRSVVPFPYRMLVVSPQLYRRLEASVRATTLELMSAGYS